MFLHLHVPGPPLGRFVELVTYYEGYQPEHTKEMLLPDGAVEIIVDFTDQPKRLFDRRDHSRSTAFRRAWISGMRRDWIVIEAARGSSMAVIRFRPGGAYPFLGFAVEGLTDVVSQLDDVLARATAPLRDRMLAAPTVAAKMAAVEAWLLDRGRRRLDLNPAVEWVARRLHDPGDLRVQEVVGEVGYSQRHVGDLFRRWVGMTPKQYARVRRFQQVLREIVRHGGVEPDWADLAAACGYYDQSHLIHEFRGFSGLTPGAYLAAHGQYENYVPLD